MDVCLYQETVKDFDACGLTLVYAKVRIVFAADVGPEKPHLKLNLQRSERPRGKRGPLLTEGMFQRLLESALRRLSSVNHVALLDTGPGDHARGLHLQQGGHSGVPCQPKENNCTTTGRLGGPGDF